MHDNQIQLASWANEAQSAVYDYATCLQPVFSGPNRLPSAVEFAIGQLQLRAALTSDSVLNLLIQLKLWDAEILLRTVVESSIKLAYIAVADIQEQHARASEFLPLLPEMLRLKRHRRVEAFLASGPEHVAAVEFAHGARLRSDVVTFASIRARAAYKALTLDTDPITKVSERYAWLFEELHSAYDSFHALEYPSDGNNSE